ncbi:unnamed protein product [Eruca vesicaria subsp. sativa]|uniref:Uncharacterized protein n=1 Tax=Eruca vesicaria subsp. sativa TaxID=29727 RepID=A0ABC8JJJ5_ERUVS|nr:unnamed protein product [Eruca vesicaria subsp. sativa]
MTTNACKFLCLILLFAFISQGFGCDGSGAFEDLYVKQSKTGKMIKNTPEWEVRLTNPCTCTATDLVLTCVGLKSLTPIDSSQISITNDECTITNNLEGGTDFVFKYVWAKKFDIQIEKGQMACS